jgi:uncharacterized protein YjiS (DUF1127 family)
MPSAFATLHLHLHRTSEGVVITAFVGPAVLHEQASPIIPLNAIIGAREMLRNLGRAPAPVFSTEHGTRAPPVSAGCSGAGLRGRASVIRRWLERCRQRRALAALDDRLLRDIGITRAQAQREAARPFWSASGT